MAKMQEIIRKDDKIIILVAYVVMRMKVMYNTKDWLAKANTESEDRINEKKFSS
jgi:hypothetical protein